MTNPIMTGTSTSGPITAANACPEFNPKTATDTAINVSGAGNLTADGKVGNQKITLSGAGNYDGVDLESKTADVTIAGLGKVVVWTTDKLDVTISGTGGVDYYGSPQVTQQISGLGRLNHAGNK